MKPYLELIRAAKVYDVARRTELHESRALSKRLHNVVLLKREDQQVSFSFKVRGAYNKMANLSREELEKGVITSSAGNHAQGVALAAAALKCRAVIVMPTTTPNVKIDAVRSFGGNWIEIVTHGESYSDTFEYVMTRQKADDLTFIPPFDDPLVIAGQGTIGMEILDAHPGPINAIFIAVGGGGLISGVGAYVKSMRSDILIVGVQAKGSDAMSQSLEKKRRIELDEVSLFSDGTAVRQVGEETFRLCREVVDEMITVDSDSICAAISDVYMDSRSILEPAGALSVAGLKEYVSREKCTAKTLIAIASGANMNFNRLRFVSQRAEVGRHKEAVFVITIPEERGTFRKLCRLVGDHSVTEFNYRIADKIRAHILVGIETQGEQDGLQLARDFTDAGFETIDLSHDELAKTHLRHMVGGPSPLAGDELLYRFEFPERPGALMRFLAGIPEEWNISLFHYRASGAEYGDVLVGLQGPQSKIMELEAYLSDVGYRFWLESDNPAYRLLLRDA